MATTPSAETRRAASRSAWPIRRFALGCEPSEDLSGCTTEQERLAMMWDLARRAWLLTGRPLPDYDRSAVPGRLTRSGR